MAKLDVEKMLQKCKEMKEASDPTPQANTLEWFLKKDPQMFKTNKTTNREHGKIWTWKNKC